MLSSVSKLLWSCYGDKSSTPTAVVFTYNCRANTKIFVLLWELLGTGNGLCVKVHKCTDRPAPLVHSLDEFASLGVCVLTMAYRRMVNMWVEIPAVWT